MLARPVTATRKRQPMNIATIIIGDHPGRENETIYVSIPSVDSVVIDTSYNVLFDFLQFG